MTRLLAIVLLCLHAGVRLTLGLRFNKTLAHAFYNSWNGSTNGTLLFEFKTPKENAFLIYEDDPGAMDFIDIFLVNGRARMRLQIGQCSSFHHEEFIEGNFSDNKWHRVRISRDFQSTYFKVDHHSSKIIKCGTKDSTFKARSSLFVGGFPLEISLNSLAFPGSFHEVLSGNRFVGCISGVKYSDSFGHFTFAILKNTSGTTADCKRACTRHYEFLVKCKHGQRCGQKITECDCLETGYESQDCTRASTSVWLNSTGYIKYNLAKDPKKHTPLKNYIAFRFRTTVADGVLLHTSVKRHFLVLEMLAGNIVLKLDLGKGELVLTAGNNKLNDNRWHWVEVKRRSHHATVILDGRVTKKGRTPGPASWSKLVLRGGNQAIYFGGGPSRNALRESYSRRNFSGFLQQFRFDEYKILDRVLLHNDDKIFTKHGLVLNAKVWDTVAPPTETVRPTTEGMTGSGNCAGSDDEDCATDESVTTTESSIENSQSTTSTGNYSNPSIVYGNWQGSASHHGVPAWVITITVVAAVISIFITILIVHRWNTRYSGSFSTASATLKSDPREPWPEPPPRTKPTITSTIPIRIEQPTIYVTSYDKV